MHAPALTPDRLLRSLNADQRRAANSASPMRTIIAPAGTGKTRTLTACIIRAIRLGGTDPREVLAFTFTRSAAQELRARISESLGHDQGDLVQCTTMHGWALSLLRRMRMVPDTARVADQDEHDAILKSLYAGPSKVPGLVTTSRLRGALNNLACTGTCSEDDDVREAVDLFGARMAKAGLLTYGELLPMVDAILDTEPGKQYASRWRDVFVDEAQDCTPLEQRMVLHHLAHARRTIVMDPRQRIYEWRGAADWPTYASEVHHLRQGYRVGQPLADGVAAIAGRAWGSTKGKPGKLLPAQHLSEASVHPEHALPDVAQQLAEHYGPHRIAVLARTRRECIRAGSVIADAQVIAGQEPTALAKMAEAFARLAINPHDAMALTHVLTADGWSPGWIAALQGRAGVKRSPMAQLVLDGDTINVSARQMASRCSTEAPWRDVLGLAAGALPEASCELPAELAVAEALGVAALPVSQALDVMAEHRATPSQQGWREVAKMGRIGCGTIHSVKGMEFDAVVLCVREDWPGKTDSEEEYRLRYVGMTRARHHLAVVHMPREVWR